MKVDVVSPAVPEAIAEHAAAAERGGASGFLVPETRYDPFVSLGLAATTTERIEIGTSVAIAFARTPMTVAVSAYGLQRLSGGRMVLGLGSQIRPHVTKRYSMPWSQPAARMREFVSALRAIWTSWQEGTRLDFRGDFYTHTLMTPMFDPGPLASGPPRVLVAGVGPRMVAAAAEVGDGLLCHPLSSPAYLREDVMPALADAHDTFEVGGMALVATGRTEDERRAAAAAVRAQIAFYASTPAYLPILERHGWTGLHEELHELSTRKAWTTMAERIDDEVLDTFAIVGEPDRVGALVRERFDGLLDRVSLAMPYEIDDDLRLAAMEGIRD